MSERAVAPIHIPEVGPIVKLVLDGLSSRHSKRAYERALLDFLAWHAGQGCPALSKALVQRYKTKLQGDGLAPSTINQRLSAVRKLALEAAEPSAYVRTMTTSHAWGDGNGSPFTKESSIFHFALSRYNLHAMTMQEGEKTCLKRPFTNANVRSASNQESIQTRRCTIK